ncbi:hypothetical protein Pan44_11320 [Caulifigura coniformis]|uniref:Uncharacterized protein n=1 Tax=Caulifigura coniformis TaxID=2527983 RepID=A0A517SAF9_9PLAN|nr:hypothetical protein [Caulifigura coniformis]QDT53117.1 hypothetical protein Pan44_11320 [Caulifigura coniformis]
MRRLLYLLYWQAQFDARRPLIWLTGASYLLVAGPILLAILAWSRGRMGLPVTGTALLTASACLSALANALLVTWLASRAADERATGFLAAVQMTNIRPVTLTAFRLTAMAIHLVPLTLMRLPLSVCCYYFGGVTFADFLTAELVVWTLTAFAGTTAIVCSQVARSSQTALMLIASVLIGVEAAFFAPRLLMRTLRMATGPASGLLDGLNEWAMVFSQWSLPVHLGFRPDDWSDWLSMAPALLVHAGAALVAAGVAWRLSFFNVIPDDSPRTGSVRGRPPRRVVGEALSWQVGAIHFRRGRLRTNANIAFTVLQVMSLCIAQFALPPIGTGLLALMISFRAMTSASMKAGVCLAYEIRDQTLATLALLPREPLDIFYSWRAGGNRISIPEFIVTAVAAPFIWWNMGPAAAGLLGLLFAIALGAPFGFLNGLCRFDWAVVTLALWIFPLGFAFLAVSIFFGAITNLWAGLGLFCLLGFVYHGIILRQIPYYFLRTVERS